MPWIEVPKRKCESCGKLRTTFYQSPSADQPQPGCRSCHEERDRARREERKAAKATEPKRQPKTQPKQPEPAVAAEQVAAQPRKRAPKKDGTGSGTAKAIAKNREPSTALT